MNELDAPPATDEIPFAGVITAWLPAFGERFTVFPGTMLLFASRSRTTTTAADLPSAGTDESKRMYSSVALTEDTNGSTGPEL